MSVSKVVNLPPKVVNLPILIVSGWRFDSSQKSIPVNVNPWTKTCDKFKEMFLAGDRKYVEALRRRRL